MRHMAAGKDRHLTFEFRGGRLFARPAGMICWALARRGKKMEKYMAWCEDYGQDEDDARKVNAYDAESAARVWAEWHDQNSAEYAIASGSGTVVTVKETASGMVEKYSVSGAAVPSYYARKVPNKI